MTSRLDRLFILLESGSSAVTRRAAAKQIGEVQKLYPHELHHLLNRLITYLHSNSWDTRIAAAQAVEAILKNVPDWTPIAIKKEQQTNNENEEKKNIEENLLSFAEFNLSHILQKGARLIGSEGSEFDVHEEGDATKSAERLSRQRALLNEKLGITQASRLGVNLTDMITDEDVKEGSNDYNINEEKVPVEHILNINTNTSHSASTSSNGQTLSCREINRAKRKARQNVAINPSNSSANLSRSNSSSNGSIPPDEPDKKKVKSETVGRAATELFYSINAPVPDATGTWVDALSWPLENFCARLYLDLFNPKWEIRHGAATALRKLINNHSAGAGKSMNATQEEMEHGHILWLEDAALRLLCVLALDRFGDFVSDQVVAPVRETCAQVLGTIVRDMPTEKVNETVSVLLNLIKQNDWEVRHAGLLGLKYIFVVREDLLQIFLPLTISEILIGLFDSVDDVGAVAASTLIPVASWLPKLLNPNQVSTIVKMLWDLLLDQDELTSACNSFMGLLAAILCLPNASTWIQMEPMSTLVPRLWPFLSHNTTSVRKSTLKTLKTLTQGTKGEEGVIACQKLETDAKDDINFDSKNLKLNFGVIDWQPPLLQEALRHIYQRILVEAQWDIQELAKEVWMNLIDYANLTALLHAACPYVSPWICLAMQPARLPFDTNILIQAAHTQVSERRRIRDDLGGCSNLQQKLFLGGNEATPVEVREKNFVRARINAARVLGALSHFLVQPAPGVEYNAVTESPMECYTKVLHGHLQSRSAVQRTVCGLIIAFWAQSDSTVRPACPKLQEKLRYCVMEYVYYDEVAMSLTRLLQEAHDFIATLKQYKIPINDFNNAKILTLEQIDALSTKMTENLKLKHNLKPKLGDMLEERRKCLQNSYQQTNMERNIFDISTQAALAGAIVCMRCLPEKLNPVVKPLMESIKREERELLQQLSAEFLVYLMDQISDRNPSPNNKIVTNLCTLLKSDTEFTPPIVTPDIPFKLSPQLNGNDTKDHYYGILTLSIQQKIGGSHSNNANVSRGPGRPPTVAVELPAENGSSVIDSNEAKLCRIQRIGSTYTIEFICKYFGATLNTKVPIIWQIMFGKIDSFLQANPTMDMLKDQLIDPISTNDLITALQLIEIAAPCIDVSLHEELFKLLPKLGVLITHPLKAVRHMVARCIATMGNIDICKTMNFVVDHLMDLLKKIENVICRQGAIETIERMVEKLQIKMVPYVVLLVVPLLGCMSDPDEAVRLLSTHCFATLIQLMPLDSKFAKTEIASKELQARKTRDREFLDYLFAPKTIPDFKVPVPITVELRCYQQAGVNWLWFLNKYNLHGILCDDMGLGKTLQAICILAGDHHQRIADKNTELPSLVICPPTLTGHWVYEVEKFLKSSFLRPLHYVGLPGGREKLRPKIGKCNLVVASYDTVRKDIDYFSTIHWNYCILDEGHIIKNGKTKSSKAIKQLKANHRLILSGTPIQNNVLELWSLFDFLMPGFLGTEKQFIARFSRPILSSRDSKSSPKEQEAGVLAMESLHRQILPFLLRRVKEDVLTDLPPKITQDLLCELSPLQERLYEDFSRTHLNSELKDCLANLGETENLNKKTHIFYALRYLQNVCNHPKLVLIPSHPEYPKITQELSQYNSCLNDIEHSAKLPALKQLLLDCGIGVETESVNQHRALIFCQLKAMLNIVENDLLKKHLPSVSYLRLDGSVPASCRQEIVNNFNSDPSIDVLLLTTKVGGLGLNLTGADTVIFVEHDWNPMKDLQAMDRAHRIGQKKVVNVYRLITRKSLEEKIMGLQKFKILTANTVVSAENASMDTMATEQLFDLFNLSDNKHKITTADGSNPSTSSSSGQMSVASVIENLPELWSENQYDEEYDITQFVQGLKK